MPSAGRSACSSAAYLLWMGASLHILQNDAGGILFSLLVMTGVSLWLALRPGGSLAEMRAFLHDHWRLILGAELLFAVTFLAWAGLRAAAADKIMPLGGEKFMEMAFLNGILNSRQFPPLDPWLSGFAISYYYFGYVMAALLTRLSGALAGVAFDLYDALLFALTSLGAFGLVYDLCSADRERRRKSGGRRGTAGRAAHCRDGQPARPPRSALHARLAAAGVRRLAGCAGIPAAGPGHQRRFRPGRILRLGVARLTGAQ